jgi:hypothetical protein
VGKGPPGARARLLIGDFWRRGLHRGLHRTVAAEHNNVLAPALSDTSSGSDLGSNPVVCDRACRAPAYPGRDRLVVLEPARTCEASFGGCRQPPSRPSHSSLVPSCYSRSRWRTARQTQTSVSSRPKPRLGGRSQRHSETTPHAVPPTL